MTLYIGWLIAFAASTTPIRVLLYEPVFGRRENITRMRKPTHYATKRMCNSINTNRERRSREMGVV